MRPPRGPGSILAVTLPTPELPAGCTCVTEVPFPGFPALVHPYWGRRFPWLVQGTTVRGTEPRPFDLGLFSGASPARVVLDAWEELRRGVRMERTVHARQVHGSRVLYHGHAEPGLYLAEACDGHATDVPGILLAVTVADCVPVFLVASDTRGTALLHAGWRGVAAGILEEGLDTLGALTEEDRSGVHLHLGPAICGRCYEVGPEVFRALDLPEPPGPTPVDLRAVLAHRAVRAGVSPEQVTVSSHCTRCGEAGLFSHRGGNRERQAAFLGSRP